MTPGYKSFNGNNKSKVLSEYSNTVDKFDSLLRKSTAFTNEIVSDIIVRQPFSKDDYEYFRPNESIPGRFNDLIKMCRSSYHKMGIIRNVIDLMTDFVSDGFKVVDADPERNKFFQLWLKQTNFTDIIQEFTKHYLIDNNVVLKRITAKMTKSVQSVWEKSIAGADVKMYKPIKEFGTKEIPWRYSFLNIVNLNWTGGELGKLTGTSGLSITLSPNIISKIRSKVKMDAESVKDLPEDFRKQVLSGQANSFELDMSKIYMAHGTKNSWDFWASPTLEAILSDVLYKQKLRQAEMSALDGVINVIRLWKLGDHKAGILPDQGAVDKLLNILQANTGGGAMDLVWDSMIEMQPFYPPIDKILGSDKYEQVNKDILIGLGVPEVLLGGKGANFSNSFIQLKTLVEKLENVRRKLFAFINNELSIVCESMGFDSLPVVQFGSIADDEGTTKKLIVGLLDRGIVSAETVLEIYGHDFKIEKKRLEDQKNQFEIKGPFKTEEDAPTNGRPFMGKDNLKRKTRVAKPRTTAITGMSFIDKIDEYYIPIYLEHIQVKNLRQITNDQKLELNDIRSYILSCIKPSDKIQSENDLVSILEEKRTPSSEVLDLIKNNISYFVKQNEAQPTIQQRKMIESLSWTEIMENENED